jgi:hypothetical protein
MACKLFFRGIVGDNTGFYNTQFLAAQTATEHSHMVSILKKWWGKKTPDSMLGSNLQAIPEPSFNRAQWALIFLFNTLPKLSKATLYQRLSDSGALQSDLHIFDEVLTPDSGQYARLRFDAHQFRWHGVSSPAPLESVAQPIACGHWSDESKAVLRAHRCHVICWYEGNDTDANTQIIAMLRLAGAFAKQGLLGWVDTDAWNCMPVQIINQALQPEALALCSREVPVGLWTGFIKLVRSENQVWFCTKGYHRWGLPDFAYLGQADEAQATAKLFVNLFHYLRQTQQTLAAGHTAQCGDQHLSFGPVLEFTQYLQGPLGTLVVEKMSAQEHVGSA